MIFDSVEAVTYFNGVFQFDWANLTKPIGAAEFTPLIAVAGAPTPSGMVRIPWRDWYGD
jgi:hypothetical protein